MGPKKYPTEHNNFISISLIPVEIGLDCHTVPNDPMIRYRQVRIHGGDSIRFYIYNKQSFIFWGCI
jgi:hypothetical protein